MLMEMICNHEHGYDQKEDSNINCSLQSNKLCFCIIFPKFLNSECFFQTPYMDYLCKNDFFYQCGFSLFHAPYLQNSVLPPFPVQMGSLLSQRTRASAHHQWRTQKMMICFPSLQSFSWCPDNVWCYSQNPHPICHSLLKRNHYSKWYAISSGPWGNREEVIPFSKFILC